MVEAYWNIGKSIVEQQGGEGKAEYGAKLLVELSKQMTADFGKGFTVANLKNMRQFYPFPKSYALRSELSWTHYRLLMRVENKNSRQFYTEEAIKSNWSTRQLERQINSFFYERLLSSQNKEKVSVEIQKLEPAKAPEDIIRDPYVLEFLGLNPNDDFYESDLEEALITHLQKFLLELGRGFSFVARQKRITFDGRHFRIDLVFYNYILKCFVLIDLKIGDLTHQDLGQMQMIADCHAGKIDMIITKSISRFARNTLDCLNYVRELKELGIGIIFEKEAINTLDAKGEVLLTILSSLAQDESRSISENSTWGIRRRFEVGQHKMSTRRFLGYDTDEDGMLVINRKQAKIVVRLFEEYLSGKTVDYIKRMFEREGVQTWNGSTKWQATTLQSMLENEKYKGDAILQKSYTTDFLTKKRAMNQGEIQMFYIEDDHEPIIEPWIWECVQLEIVRRKKYMEDHGTNSYSHYTEQNPFAARIVCGNCNKVFTRKGWQSRNGDIRRVWQCSERYKVKGVMGCSNRHVEEATLRKVFIQAWNTLLENREHAVPEWEEAMKGNDLLTRYRTKDFLKLTENAQPIEELDTDLMLRVLDHIKVFEEGMLMVVFLDGTEIEYRVE